MPKVRGPLFSLTASGTLDRTLTYSTNGTETTVKKLPSFEKPRTANQAAHAAKVADMSASWLSLSAGTKTLWNNCAALSAQTGYRLYWREWFIQASTPGSPPVLPC